MILFFKGLINKKTIKRTVSLMLAFIMCFFSTSCGKKKEKSEPITITLWHVYGEMTKSPLNDMIDEFNKTVGYEKGIKVQVTVVSNTSEIHEAVLRAARKEPGAGELPDMFISYPKTVMALPDRDILVDYNDYFTEDELDAYIPEFIEEGKIDDKLSVFPLAKSTEVLFVNKTLFDRFAKETGASVEQLSTWEGLFQVAQKYYDWTNAKTPDIDNDGKTFFAHDYHFNYLQVGVESMGESFFEGDGIKDSVELKRAFKLYADAAINGTIWVNESFATEPLRTGEVISSVASSASVLYYDDYVTYDDNTTEFVEFIALPVPVFEGADNLVMQRGAGVCTIKSIPEKEKAAATFLRWITSPENNTRLVTQLGYMPVTEKAFQNISTAISEIESKKYKSLYEAFQKTQQNFTFYSAPKLDNYLEMETLVEKTSRSMMKARRDELLKNGGNIDTLIENAYKEFIEIKP